MLRVDDVLREAAGIEPEDYACLSIATDGIQVPIRILEVCLKFPGEEPESVFVLPQDGHNDSELNFGYTGITQPMYEKAVSPFEAESDLVEALSERNTSLVIVNNTDWTSRLAKQVCNSGLVRMFLKIDTLAQFPVVTYENARLAGFSMHNCREALNYKEILQRVKSASRMCPSDRRCDLEAVYAMRGGEEASEGPGFGRTLAQVNTERLEFIWQRIAQGTEMTELYN